MEYKFQNVDLLNKIVNLTTKDENQKKTIYKSELLSLFNNVLNKSSEVNQTTYTQKPIECITLSDSEDEIANPPDVTLNATLTQPANTQIQDYFNYLLDTLESGDDSDTLSESDFKLILSYSSRDLEKLIKYLDRSLSWTGIHNLCLTLSMDNLHSLENFNVFMKLFCSNLLLPKFLTIELPRDIELGLNKLMKKTCATVICEALIINVIMLDHPNWKLLTSLCESLKDNEKEFVLRKLIDQCNKLEERHIELLETLYQPNFDNNLKRSFIELLGNSGEQFSESKIFGKLFVKLCKSLQSKTEFEHLEHALFCIVEHNKTIFKGAANKILINFFKN